MITIGSIHSSIQGSDAAQSDENGEVSVAFWCDGNTGSGTITGFTVNANNEQITASLPVICSNSEALIVATPWNSPLSRDKPNSLNSPSPT